METGIKVGDCMSTSLITISDADDVFKAANIMKEHDVGSLLVTNSKNQIHAIVTDTDIVHKAVAQKKLDVRVKDVASKPLVGVSPETDLRDAAKLMGEKNLKRLVVFKDRKQIVGIISERDIVRISPSLYDLIAERERLKA